MKLHFGIVFQSSNFNHENYVKSVSFYMFDHVFGHTSVKNSFDRFIAKYTIKHIKNLQTIENFTDLQNQVENNKLTECCLIFISCATRIRSNCLFYKHFHPLVQKYNNLCLFLLGYC